MSMPFEKRNAKYLIVVFAIGITIGYICGSYFPLEKLLPTRRGHHTLSVKSNGEKELKINEGKEVTQDKLTPEACNIHVEVAGAVSYPGVYCMPKDSLVADALKKAGGENKLSARRYILQKINKAQRITDNQKIYIPFEDDLICEAVKFTLDNSLDRYLNGEDTKEENNECVDINFATVKELDALPGVGNVTAEKIVESRPYKQLADLKTNKVISDKIFTQIENLICL